jgi:hypothetical protein
MGRLRRWRTDAKLLKICAGLSFLRRGCSGGEIFIPGVAEGGFRFGKQAPGDLGCDVQALEGRCILKVLAVFFLCAAPWESRLR